MERSTIVRHRPLAPASRSAASVRAFALAATSALAFAAAAAVFLLPASAAAQANLIPNLPSGWAYPVVPRPTNDAASNSVPAPATLTGDATATYLNTAWRNVGTIASGAFHNNTVLDGSRIVVDRSCASLAAGGTAQGINGGPFAFYGGRHTLELRVDSGGAVTESDETDNAIAHQWVWTPATLAAGAYALRDGPPDPAGGRASIPSGYDSYDNCDGVRFTTGGGWNVVYAWSADASVDYDAYLYEPSTGAANGFASPLAASQRGGRGLDGVIANGHTVGARDYDVGFKRYAGTAQYRVSHAASTDLPMGWSTDWGFAENEMLKVFDVFVSAEQVGPVTVDLQLTKTDPSVMVLWADRAFTAGSLTDITATAATDENGHAWLHVNAPVAGDYCVILMRDPDWGTGVRTFHMWLRQTYPDLIPATPAGWHSPLVPRPSQDGTPTSAALPDTLPAYTTGAYFNWAVRNISGLACPTTSSTRLFVDGSNIGTFSTPALGVGETYSVNPTWHWELLAGRHTASVQADVLSAFTEMSTTNNAYGEQYCWAPVSLSPLNADMGWDPVPPPLFGGTDAIPAGGETIWYNCNGRRIPAASAGAWWQAFAISPRLGDDYDIQLHEALVGAKNGFAEPLATSGWGSGQTDYVLVNLNVAPRRPYDVGVIKMSGTNSYHPQYIESTSLGSARAMTLPLYECAYYEIVQLYEWYFTPGNWIFHLDNQSNMVRFGMTLHPSNLPYQGKLSGPAAYPSADGGDVWLQAMVTAPGYYCLAVWRQDRREDYIPRYQLSISPGGSPVPDGRDVPAATALAGASPNPFNPRTTVAFDLATTGRARLAVYDLRGALVRSLVDADLAAGRQSVVWDGRDDCGRAVPSGTYLARLEANGIERTQKLMLAK